MNIKVATYVITYLQDHTCIFVTAALAWRDICVQLPVSSSVHINHRSIIRIVHGCEVLVEKYVRGSLLGITRLCQVMPNSDPEGRIFLSAPNNHDRLFFLHTFWSPVLDFNIGVTINEWCSYTLTSAILKGDIAMTSTPNDLTTELRDLLYNQCIDNTLLFIFFLSHRSDKGM